MLEKELIARRISTWVVFQSRFLLFIRLPHIVQTRLMRHRARRGSRDHQQLFLAPTSGMKWTTKLKKKSPDLYLRAPGNKTATTVCSIKFSNKVYKQAKTSIMTYIRGPYGDPIRQKNGWTKQVSKFPLPKLSWKTWKIKWRRTPARKRTRRAWASWLHPTRMGMSQWKLSICDRGTQPKKSRPRTPHELAPVLNHICPKW